MAMVFINICLSLFLFANIANGIGVNWGQTTSINLQPYMVVQLLKDNGISSVKLFGSDELTIKAFAKTGISVMVGIRNEDLKNFTGTYANAKEWVKKKIEKPVKSEGVNITYIAVGNEPFSKIHNGIYVEKVFPAIKNIQKALDEAGLGKIKVTTPLNEDVYESQSNVPSKSDFRADIKKVMVEIVSWFNTNKSPFVVNINPFRSYQDLGFSYDSVFFSSQAKPFVTDKNASYTNIFDLSIDKLAWSLKSAGVPDLKIIVGEIGYPTDGNINANKTLAQKFYTGFLKQWGSNKGTPLRPGPVEVFLSSLLDEDMRSIAQGNHERHWGIFRFDGVPKYPIDFSGQGRSNITPVSAKDVKYISPFYCIFNEATQTNRSLIPANLDYICKAADCTALTYGSSCNNLNFIGNVSYMFNMYYQMYRQQDNSCNFNGLGTFSIVDPSIGTCLFPIQIKSAAGMRVAFGTSEIVVGVLAMALLALLSKGV